MSPCLGQHDAAARRGGVTAGLIDYGVIPAAEHVLVPTAWHNAVASTNLSLITVEAMFAAFTHIGVSREAGSSLPEPEAGLVVELTRADGGVCPARIT